MKKLLTFTLLLCTYLSLEAQQLFAEVYSGYSRTAYELESFNTPAGFVPIGIRLAGGLEHVQLGVEYNQNITNPAFISVDDLTSRETRTEFVKSYYGGLLRINASSLPAYRFGVVFKLGAGKYNLARELFDNPGETQLADPIEYDPIWGFKGGVGISSPIYTLLHWEIGYQFNFVKWDEFNAIPAYNGYYHSFEAGLSFNMVFGNVAKKCRRVISSGGGKRGW